MRSSSAVGTEESDGQCVVTGETVTCGAGTMLDANSGECVASAAMPSCGANTAYDATSDSCLPTDTVCAPGTTFEPAMSVCMPDVACEAGDIVIDGICVAPFEELWATATTLSVENDDPFRGGTATPITLAAEGVELVLGGTVDPTTDLDADGVDDNDLDVFEFTTDGPRWLTITVQSDTQALTGFFVATVDETWLRQGPLTGPRGSAREVLVPAAGTYRVGFGTPLLGHGVGARWVGTVQVDPMPTPTAFTFGSAIDGDLDQPETGMLEVASFDGAATLSVSRWPVEASAAIMVFDGTSWAPVVGADLPMPTTPLLGAGSLRFFVDPLLYGPSLDRTYSIDTAVVPGVVLGPITPGQTLTAAPQTIGAAGVLYTVDSPAGVVLDVVVNSGPVDVEILSPAPRTIPFVGDQGVSVPMPAAGAVTLRLTTFGPPLQGVEVVVTAHQPTDLGTVASQGTLPVMVGDLDGPTYFTVAFPANEVAKLQQTNAAGDIVEVTWWGPGWDSENRQTLVDATQPFGTRTLSFEGLVGSQLVEVRTPFAVGDLALTFSSTASVPLGVFNLGDTLSIVDTMPHASGDTVFYSFTLTSAALATGTIEAGGEDVDGRIVDAMGVEVWVGATGEGEDVTAVLPAGDYTLSVIPFANLASGFVVDIDFGSLPSTTEVEPNDTAATASPGLAVGTPVLGSAGPDPDWYSFTVTNPGIFEVTVNSFSGPVDVSLADATGAVISAPLFPDRNRQRGFLEAGDYTVEVFGGAGDYLIELTRTDSGADVDDAGANDTSTAAQAVPNAPGDTIAGVVLPGDEDWYTFTLAAPTDLVVSSGSSSGASRAANVEILDASLAVQTSTGSIYTLGAGVHYLRVFGTPTDFPDYRLSLVTVPGTVYTSSPALAIPDDAFPMVVTDVINVPTTCVLTNIFVQVDITHTYIGDLVIHVISPTGTDLALWDRSGDGTDDLVGVFGLDLTSVDALSGLQGEEAMGDWTITLSDGAGSDTGTLNSWSILVDCQ